MIPVPEVLTIITIIITRTQLYGVRLTNSRPGMAASPPDAPAMPSFRVPMQAILSLDTLAESPGQPLPPPPGDLRPPPSGVLGLFPHRAWAGCPPSSPAYNNLKVKAMQRSRAQACRRWTGLPCTQAAGPAS